MEKNKRYMEQWDASKSILNKKTPKTFVPRVLILFSVCL